MVTDTFQSFSSLLFGNSSYKLSNKLYVDFPEFENRVSKAEKKSIGSNIFERFSEVFFDEKPGDGKEYIQIYGRENSSRIFKWIKREYVENHDNLEKWKVFVPGANGSGALGETLSTPLIGSPLIGGTQTFISFGAFDDSLEAENVFEIFKNKICSYNAWYFENYPK